MNNLEMMRKRLEYQGGIHQEDRMIRGKYLTFQKTLQFSYQAASVSLVQKSGDFIAALDSEPIEKASRALINPDKLKQDYDDKILSIDTFGWRSEEEKERQIVTPGDVFKWRGTNSYWIIYLEQLTEDAYFRGSIRRCNYQIKFKDEDDGNVYTTHAAIRGPVETQIDSIQKNQERIDNPNFTLSILLPKNEKTSAAFDRYYEFLFHGRCWMVTAIDDISMPNIIELTAREYYIDRDTDDTINEVKNGLQISPIDETPDTEIEGRTWIKPLLSYDYSVDIADGVWRICSGAPVEIQIKNDKTATIKWMKSTSGQFTLQWEKDDITYKKVIVVESLF